MLKSLKATKTSKTPKRSFKGNELEILTVFLRLQSVINARKKSTVQSSYVASILQAKIDKPIKKIAEELSEFIVAFCEYNGKKNTANRKKVIAEAADLWFHLQVALAYQNINLSDIALELKRREGESGHSEKARRIVLK